jgi:hypothetical protein
MPKTYLHHPDGTVTVEDTRTPPTVYLEQLERLRAACTASILAVAPEHTQRNAALGIVPAGPVVADIASRRDEYHQLAASLQAAFDGVGTDAERCDAMEAIQWLDP